jgi:hypothetical protein
MEWQGNLVHQTSSQQHPELTSHKHETRRSIVLHLTAKEREQCNRLAKNAYWLSLSKARSDVQQSFNGLMRLQEH